MTHLLILHELPILQVTRQAVKWLPLELVPTLAFSLVDMSKSTPSIPLPNAEATTGELAWRGWVYSWDSTCV